MACALSEKVAVITGSARGIGRAFAEILLDNGAKVSLCDVDVELGKETEKELQQKYSKERVFFLKCDVSSATEFESMLKETINRYGVIDILCNNAGISDEKNWQHMLDINLSAVIQGTLLGLRYMGQVAGCSQGVIINVSSAAGVLPLPFGPMYTATKHGVVGFTRSIGVLSPKLNNVRVNCLCPSFTETGLIKMDESKVLDMFESGPYLIKTAENLIETVGIMQPHEVAECIIKLVTDESLSGEVMLVTPDIKKILSLPKTIPEIAN